MWRFAMQRLWDGGIDVHLGDEMNGYVAEETVAAVSERALASGSHRTFLPDIDLRRFVDPRGSGARRCSAVSHSADRRTGELPSLRRP
jgi:hypothetical protein